jgi:hypothetical protein
MVAERLNLRFRRGHPSNVLEDAGVVMHQFDGCLTETTCGEDNIVGGFPSWECPLIEARMPGGSAP